MKKTINDQDAIALASAYDITIWGLKPPNLPKTVQRTNPSTKRQEIVENPTEHMVKIFAESELEHKIGKQYIIVDSVHDQDTGLDAIVVKNIENGSHFVVFQGSQTTYKMKDWKSTNLNLLLNKVDAQHVKALEQVEVWQQKYGIEGVSGNSLAGSLVQFIVIAHPNLWGRTINSAGINSEMFAYLKEAYPITDEQIIEIDLINFYTKTDILQRVLGLQKEEGIAPNNEISPRLFQVGKQLVLEKSGDFSLSNIAIEHTGHDRVTIYGPFDPLTKNFMQGTRMEGEDGSISYQIAASIEIALDVEQLTTMACNLVRSLDAHHREMASSYQALAEHLNKSCHELDHRKIVATDEIYKIIMGSEDGFMKSLLLRMSLTIFDNSPLLIKLFEDIQPYTMKYAARILGLEKKWEPLKNLLLEGVMLKKKLGQTITHFLEACDLQNKIMLADTMGYSSSGMMYNSYSSNNYVQAPMEESLRKFLEKCLADSNTLLSGMDYYRHGILTMAVVFSKNDGSLAKKIENANIKGEIRAVVNIESFAEIGIIHYDNKSFIAGFNEQKRLLMEQNYYLFKDFIQTVLDSITNSILPQVVLMLDAHRQKPYKSIEGYLLDYATFHVVAEYEDLNTEKKAVYRQQYQKNTEVVNQYNRGIDEMIIKVTEIGAITKAANIDAMLSEQFKEQLLQVLFKDTALYGVMEYTQKLAAHHSISAQLIGQVNANLGYNKGQTIDALIEIGKRVQIMAEIGESHLMRLRV
ncbi:hypothetical protein AwErysi_09500 [Erysipelotrichaceae bacterium]|nr:hypothetical protein AwErysi_09500 [Erysipelotrichaceae bacterium]